MFILCLNPFIDFVLNWLSDNLRFPITRACADDFGSNLDQLCRNKIQASIFKLAQSVAGLDLTPCWCIIITTCITISDELIHAAKLWLMDNDPECYDFLISSSGKYWGWYIGMDSASLSFQDPIKKFVHRIHEVVAGSAPATIVILRYVRERSRCFPLYFDLHCHLWVPVSLDLISGQFTNYRASLLIACRESCVIVFHISLRLILLP